MKYLKLFATFLLLLGGFMSFVPASTGIVYAADPLEAACKKPDGSIIDSPTCQVYKQKNTTNPLTGTNGTLLKITQILALVAGVAAVIAIVLGGMNYITSAGDTQKAAKARGMVLGAVIGLIIIVSANFIISFVLKRL